jgi:glycosyltransferase involved in cell wall biosynthesis
MKINTAQMKLADLTVIVSWHNGARYVETLSRVISQICGHGGQIIVINDGSTDGSELQIDRYADGLDGFKLFNRINEGSASSRNFGIHQVQTEYLVFMDYDDSINSENLIKCLELFRVCEGDLAITEYLITPENIVKMMPPLHGGIERNRDEIFENMGFWRYIYRTRWVLEQKLFFYPSFAQAGGFFILDDAYFMLQIAASSANVLDLKGLSPFYEYQLDPLRPGSWERYLAQVTLIPQVSLSFLKSNQYLSMREKLDFNWLEERLMSFTLQSISRLNFVDSMLLIPTIFSQLRYYERSYKKIFMVTSKVVLTAMRNTLSPIKQIFITYAHKISWNYQKSESQLQLRVSGGLGNQLFAFAAGFSLAKMMNKELIISAEKVSLGSNPSRLLELNSLELEQYGLIYGKMKTSKISKFRLRIERRIGISNMMSKKSNGNQVLVSNNDSIADVLKRVPNHSILEGHYINSEWFEIASKFGYQRKIELKNERANYTSAKKILHKNSALVHVRIGDYLVHPDIFPIVSENYILNAMEYLKSKGVTTYFVLTDSSDEFSRRFPIATKVVNWDLVRNYDLSPAELLKLMSIAPALITSNSTFSVSAALHSSICGERVVTPIPHMLKDWQDHLPKSWHRIPINIGHTD